MDVNIGKHRLKKSKVAVIRERVIGRQRGWTWEKSVFEYEAYRTI